jgi:integrase
LSKFGLGRADDGTSSLIEVPAKKVDAAVAAGWQPYLEKRRAKSARTIAFRAKLANKHVSAISKVELDGFVSTMQQDGASDSQVQKEIALLKAVFNTAIDRWNWVGFQNPCAGIKLGGSESRFVHVSNEQMLRLYEALAKCDNPWVWPLVDCAIYLTARKKSLLTLMWKDVNLEGRCAILRDSKAGTVRVPLAPRVVEVLSQLPRHESGRVFPMTSNAVKMAWEGVRHNAGLDNLQFRDTRHLGGTYYAKLVKNAHILRQILGHKTLYMAQIYVSLTETDVAEHLEELEKARGPQPMPPLPTVVPAQPQRVSKKAQRVIDAVRQRQRAQQEEAKNGGASEDARKGAVVVQFPVHARVSDSEAKTPSSSSPAAAAAAAAPAAAASSSSSPSSATTALTTMDVVPSKLAKG